jgi:pimeloyl-ACP methyl ester carboxylesterase
MLEMKSVQTSHGVIPLHMSGEGEDRPVVLAICGAFAPFDYLSWLGDRLPEAEVVITHLPGLLTAPPDVVSVSSFAYAFIDLIESFYIGRRIVVIGLSVGGLVALSINSESVAAVIAVDPPLSTAKLWPLIDWASMARGQMTPTQQDWLWRIFGYGSTIEDRCYHDIVSELSRPARVIVAGDSLGARRQITELPGLLDTTDVEFLKRNNLISVQVVDGVGHDVAVRRPEVLVAEIRAALTP